MAGTGLANSCSGSARFAHGSASAEKVGQGEVGGVTCSVTCTRWLLGLAVKAPWLGLGGSILALALCTMCVALHQQKV